MKENNNNNNNNERKMQSKIQGDNLQNKTGTHKLIYRSKRQHKR